MANTSLQKYDISDNDLNEQTEQAKQGRIGGFSKLFKFPEGKTTIRIAPPRPDAKVRSPFFIVSEHFVDIPGVGRGGFVCPRAQANQKCPLCEKALKLLATGNPKDADAAQKLSPEPKAYTAFLVRGQESRGWQVAAFTSGTHKKLKMILQDPDPADGGNFTHPMTGFDIVITRTGQELATRYDVKARTSTRGPLENDPDEMDDLLASIPDLSKHGNVPTLEEIQAKLRGERSPKTLSAGKRAEDYSDE